VSTVSGSVPVSASVTVVGFLIVEGVQFKLDGANLGTETRARRTRSPGYACREQWLTYPDGVARDAFGARYTPTHHGDGLGNAPPPDTTPRHGITSRAAAERYRDVTVTASASDNVGVAGVQFPGGCAALGARTPRPVLGLLEHYSRERRLAHPDCGRARRRRQPDHFRGGHGDSLECTAA